MPKTVTATGKKVTIPYLPVDVPPSKARKGQTAGKMGVKGSMKGTRPS